MTIFISIKGFKTNEEDGATVGLGRREVKASSSMLPRSVPPLGETFVVLVMMNMAMMMIML